MRTTLDLDKPILDQLKALGRKEKKSLGRIASELLADSLSRRREPQAPKTLAWNAKAMAPRVDIDDKDALYQALEQDQ